MSAIACDHISDARLASHQPRSSICGTRSRRSDKPRTQDIAVGVSCRRRTGQSPTRRDWPKLAVTRPNDNSCRRSRSGICAPPKRCATRLGFHAITTTLRHSPPSFLGSVVRPNYLKHHGGDSHRMRVPKQTGVIHVHLRNHHHWMRATNVSFDLRVGANGRQHRPP